MSLNIEELKQLKTKMDSLTTMKDILKAKKEQFEADNKKLIESITTINNDIFEQKNVLRCFAEQEFLDTGSKKLLGGLGIRDYKTLKYDAYNAFDWALEHKIALMLDVKTFEKIAKTNALPFVTVEEKTTVTFPKEIKVE